MIKLHIEGIVNMFSVNNYRRNFKHGLALSRDLLVEVSSQIIETV